MTDSSFNDALDAMVRGQRNSNSDDLSQFVGELYAKEQNTMMPLALKTSIGESLGFEAGGAGASTDFVTPKRVASSGELTRRPWFAAAAVVIAISLALTGVLQWSLPNGDDGDGDNSGVLSSIVPSASATPAASPDGMVSSEFDWLAPVSPEECPVDDLVSVGEMYQSPVAEEWRAREGAPFELADEGDAADVVTRQRQMLSCMNSQDMQQLPVLSTRALYERWSPDFPEGPDREALWRDQIQRSKELSAWVEYDLGLTPADLIHQVGDVQPGPVWEPGNAVQMADGRVALIPSWLTTSSETQPGYAFVAPVWVLESGQWMVDEELFFCIGDCDNYWAEKEASILPVATPTMATPSASETDPNAWLYPIDVHECPVEETERVDQQNNPAATWYSMDEYDQVDSAPEYEPIALADPADANAVMIRLRQQNACGMMPNQALPEFWTVRWEYENRTTAGREEVAADQERRDEGRRAIAAWYENELNRQPSDFIHIEDPDEHGLEGTSPNVVTPLYNPADAVELGDGRIAIPVSQVVYDDPESSNLNREFPAYYPPVAVFAWVDGEWRLDETFQICIGECDDFWAGEMATPMASPAATNPDANAWLYPVEIHECPVDDTERVDRQNNPDATWYTLDDYAGVDTLPEYAPISRADPDDATAVMTRLRQLEACTMVPNKMLPEFWTVRWEFETRTTEGREVVATDQPRRTEAAMEISRWYETELGLAPEDLVVQQDPEELGLNNTSTGMVHTLFDPAHAIQLEDGRIGMIGSQVMYRVPDASELWGVTYYPTVVIFAYADGEWRLDETMPICLGECDDFWAGEMATPVASPVAVRP